MKDVMVQKSISVFVAYAHEDEYLLKGLKTHLNLLERSGFVKAWYDRDITAGTEWEREIDAHLNTAQIILLLISAKFLDSNYCYSIEMRRAIERHETGEARVIPIILRPVEWQEESILAKLQALPRDGRPVVSWSGSGGRDRAFTDIVRGIREAAKDIKTQTLTEPSVAQSMTLDISQKTKAQLLDEGNALFNISHYQEAMAAFEQVIHLDPYNDYAWFNKARCLYHLRLYEDALAAYEQVIQLKPNYLLAYLSKGWVLYDLKRYEEAFASYDQAIHLDPTYARAYNDKSVLLRESKRYHQALEVLEQAIRLKPDYTYAYLNKGLILDDLERPQEALAAFEQAIQYSPTYARAYYEKGRVLKNLGRLAEAQLAYEKARQHGYEKAL